MHKIYRMDQQYIKDKVLIPPSPNPFIQRKNTAIVNTTCKSKFWEHFHVEAFPNFWCSCNDFSEAVYPEEKQNYQQCNNCLIGVLSWLERVDKEVSRLCLNKFNAPKCLGHRIQIALSSSYLKFQKYEIFGCWTYIALSAQRLIAVIWLPSANSTIKNERPWLLLSRMSFINLLWNLFYVLQPVTFE